MSQNHLNSTSFQFVFFSFANIIISVKPILKYTLLHRTHLFSGEILNLDRFWGLVKKGDKNCYLIEYKTCRRILSFILNCLKYFLYLVSGTLNMFHYSYQIKAKNIQYMTLYFNLTLKIAFIYTYFIIITYQSYFLGKIS